VEQARVAQSSNSIIVISWLTERSRITRNRRSADYDRFAVYALSFVNESDKRIRRHVAIKRAQYRSRAARYASAAREIGVRIFMRLPHKFILYAAMNAKMMSAHRRQERKGGRQCWKIYATHLCAFPFVSPRRTNAENTAEYRGDTVNTIIRRYFRSIGAHTWKRRENAVVNATMIQANAISRQCFAMRKIIIFKLRYPSLCARSILKTVNNNYPFIIKFVSYIVSFPRRKTDYGRYKSIGLINWINWTCRYLASGSGWMYTCTRIFAIRLFTRPH